MISQREIEHEMTVTGLAYVQAYNRIKCRKAALALMASKRNRENVHKLETA